MPTAANSDELLREMTPSGALYADFGGGTHREGITRGIPYVIVSADQHKSGVDFQYESESDQTKYPIPDDAPIEGGPQSRGDRHVLMIDEEKCRLYELFGVAKDAKGRWKAGSGATFDLRSNKLRPAGWTSADAAGLPIFPGLIRYDEVAAGGIQHAIRFTIDYTRDAYVWPARHSAGNADNDRVPPMGLRLRLKKNFNIESFSPEIQVILRALKTYGMMLADNGPAWDITGTPDERWNSDHLKELGRVHGSDFEVVNVEPLVITPDSAQARQ
jgi:hypothetical protein